MNLERGDLVEVAPTGVRLYVVSHDKVRETVELGYVSPGDELMNAIKGSMVWVETVAIVGVGWLTLIAKNGDLRNEQIK